MPKLEITNRTVTVYNRILNLRTVTSIAKWKGKRPFPVPCSFLFLAAALLFFAIALYDRPSLERPALFTILGSGAFLVFAVRANLKPRTFWLLRVETASGSANVVASKEEGLIDEAVRRITEALEADVAYHHTVNIADSTVISDSIVENSNIKNLGKSK